MWCVKSGFISCTIVSVLIGCASTESLQPKIDSWIGASIGDLTLAYGEPTQTTTNDGVVRHTFKLERLEKIQGIDLDLGCTIQFELVEQKVRSGKQVGGSKQSCKWYVVDAP